MKMEEALAVPYRVRNYFEQTGYLCWWKPVGADLAALSYSSNLVSRVSGHRVSHDASYVGINNVLWMNFGLGWDMVREFMRPVKI